MAAINTGIALTESFLSNLQILRAKPSIIFFLLKYMRKFKIQNVGGNLIIHSHLPSLNSKAYTRFINEHLLVKSSGPTHAQVSLTNACPQNCRYCYNRNRSGELINTAEIIGTIQELKKMGVIWLGFTGGEPLLNKDIVEIVKSAGDDCATKLFTSGSGLTEDVAVSLKQAGLLYVSVSLDHRQEEVHDSIRGFKGAYRTALDAVELFKKTGFHVSVSSVISKEMIRKKQVDEFLTFLQSLDINEAWLSETKPATEAFWNKDSVISEEERLYLVDLQDRYNKEGNLTVNYLGHFEGKEHFGCNAGSRMVYIDAFGDVRPCVFTPVSFGNIRDTSIRDIFMEMKSYFPSESSCFINKNYELIKKYSKGISSIGKDDTIEMMKEVRFGPQSEFMKIYSR